MCNSLQFGIINSQTQKENDPPLPNQNIVIFPRHTKRKYALFTERRRGEKVSRRSCAICKKPCCNEHGNNKVHLSSAKHANNYSCYFLLGREGAVRI